MTAGARENRSGGRQVLALGLIVFNVVLLLLNLNKHDLLPFGSEQSNSVESAASTSTVTEASADSTQEEESVTEEVTSEETAETVDDWPGGRGTVPEGPPIGRRVRIEPDGSVIITGSAPDWATAMQVADYAAANLPEGLAKIDNQLAWHPEASGEVQSGVVAIDQAATFDLGQSDIHAESLPALNLVAEVLRSRPSLFAVVIGHTDNVGDEQLNAELALGRANAVVEYLVTAGVVPDQLVVASAGEDDPFASNETEEGRTINRRIELQFKNFLIPPQDFS